MSPARFKRARKTLRLTQAEMAEILGLGAASRISDMETGRQSVTRQTEILVELYLDRHTEV